MSDTNKNTPTDETPDFDTEAFGRRFREVMEAPEHNDDGLYSLADERRLTTDI